MAWYGKFETAVSIDGNPWRILEGYETATEANKGHIKYENMSSKMNFPMLYAIIFS